MILEAPPLKDGDGKELHKLHDTIQQHTRALKAMDCELSGPFLTSVIELTLDTTTMFKWQKHSQDASSMPHYLDLLEFINLRAPASETSTPDGKKLSKGEIKRNFLTSKPVTSFATNTDISESQVCVLCLVVANSRSCLMMGNCQISKHIISVSTVFDRVILLESANLFTIVENVMVIITCYCIKKQPGSISPRQENSSQVATHTTISIKSQSLLMTCHVLLHSPNGSCVFVRALLDSAFSASFISN